ncbi:MAG: cation:dicarboxylase symporter family transporter [Sphingomonadales bacterium]|nr:cation:dicarboxylase symporter family transporter [Sphingomonadales bacterium]MDE2569522.1 cation:dicarboxylase symporter family transporter [Sphingomonadales bacterium]
MTTDDTDPLAAPLPRIAHVPAALTFASLVAGLALGLLLSLAAPGALPPVLAVAGPVGALWLQALQATIVPLVAGLLFTGVVQTVAMASAGAMARRSLGLFLGVLSFSAVVPLFVTPALLSAMPIPGSAGTALGGGLAAASGAAQLPNLTDYLLSLIPANVIEAAASGKMLPMITFITVFALAATRLHRGQRDHLVMLFNAIASAMLVVIGWVLALAPVGVFALSLTVAAKSGAGAIGALAHYVMIVVLTGTVVFLAGYALAVSVARRGLGEFARAMVPVQVFALSTQSSLASLPVMLDACRELRLRATTGEFVLPLAVALFRATSPAMNLAVVIYVARWYGVPLSLPMMVSGAVVAVLVSLSSVSLPGALSYVASVGPIALAMGVPVAPLAILVAVEMLPDLMRTLGNVTLDVAVTAAVDRAAPRAPAESVADGG